LAVHPVPSQAVDERPIRVRIDPPAEEPPRRPSRITKRGVAAFLVLFALTIFAAQSCQQSQVRLSKERAIETARPEAGFTPRRTQVRLVRQGLNGHPFWAVSFSVPAPSGDGYSRLTTVRVDANSGTVESVNREK
jgi:hypothetical protein